MTAVQRAVFETPSVPPPGGSTEISLRHWEAVKSRGIRPTFAGPQSEDPELRREFLVGARMMGYELVDLDDHELIASMRMESPPRYAIQPQQLWIVDSLNGATDEAVVEIVRRASKTTTIFCWAIGRCACRPGYQVTYSAQSGVKSAARMREWSMRLDRTCPDPEAGVAPWRRGLGQPSKARQRHLALFGDDLVASAHSEPTTRGFRILLGMTGQGIYFENGSTFLVYKPDAGAYRGEAGDVSWLDEAQELDPDEGAELLAGLLPLQDTKDNPLTVVSGTAGEARVGPLWDRVNELRTGKTTIGGVDYCAPEDTPWEDIEDEERAMELVQLVHPGIGTLTTLEKMRARWRKLPKPQWAREYLSMWPETFGQRAIEDAVWIRAGLPSKPTRPPRVAFGLAIKPRGGSAAIAAAWRSSTGLAYVEIVDHRTGTKWLPERMQELTTKNRGSTIAYDDIGEGRATATEAERLSPKPKLRVQTLRDLGAGCVQFERDLDRGTLRHAHQLGLDAAIEIAAKREVRGDTGLWLWTPGEPGADITPLDAATRALRNWDQHHARRASGAGSTTFGD